MESEQNRPECGYQPARVATMTDQFNHLPESIDILAREVNRLARAIARLSDRLSKKEKPAQPLTAGGPS